MGSEDACLPPLGKLGLDCLGLHFTHVKDGETGNGIVKRKSKSPLLDLLKKLFFPARQPF